MTTTKHHQPNHRRILAIAPTSRGIGFAVLDGEDNLGDWGVQSVKGDKNAESLLKVEKLLSHYGPGILVIEDASAEGSRRAPRIRELAERIAALAATQRVRTVVLARREVRRWHFEDGIGTKHALAETLAKRFPEELGFLLPPKRKLWMNEDYRLGIFEAVALALAVRLRQKRRVSARASSR